MHYDADAQRLNRYICSMWEWESPLAALCPSSACLPLLLPWHRFVDREDDGVSLKEYAPSGPAQTLSRAAPWNFCETAVINSQVITVFRVWTGRESPVR